MPAARRAIAGNDRPSVAIIGAGPAGLAIADQLADSHQVHLFDARCQIGGVWAQSDTSHDQQQAYTWLVTNTPTELFPYPSFPLQNQDWDDDASIGTRNSHRRSAYVPSRVVQRYYHRFACERRLHDGPDGRIARLRLCTRAQGIDRVAKKANGNTSCQWSICASTQDCSETLYFDRLVIAIGAFHEPNIPRWARDMDHRLTQQVVHSSRLGDDRIAERLSAAKRVIVVGGGKSALDVLAHVASLPVQKELILLRRSLSSVAAWCVPSGRLSALGSRLPLLGSKSLSPWPCTLASQDGSQDHDWSKAWLGRTMIKAYWSLLAKICRLQHPRLFADVADVGWKAIMRGTARLFPAPAGLQKATGAGGILKVVTGEVVSIDIEPAHEKTNSLRTIRLQPGHTHTADTIQLGENDIVVLCTGYKAPTFGLEKLFKSSHLAAEMGLPLDVNVDARAIAEDERPVPFSDMLRKAVREFLKASPVLHSVGRAESDATLATFRLYRHIVPCAQAILPPDSRTFAVVGLPQTLSAAIVSEMQARWLKSYFTTDGAQTGLKLPTSHDEALDETARLCAASIVRYGASDCRQGTAMAMELGWYSNLLSADLKGQSTSKIRALQPQSSVDWI